MKQESANDMRELLKRIKRQNFRGLWKSEEDEKSEPRKIALLICAFDERKKYHYHRS
jgi:hypothetical protein